ncbi:unnamed protein product, partial [Brenthis ino]
MIQFTIKTLDSRDHPFTVDDEATVHQLKEKILEQMGIEIGLQRLIFCGRVLQDHKKLSDYGVEGKVVHMVQRAPPSVEARDSALRDRERESERENAFTSQANITPNPILSPLHLNHITQQQIRRLVALAASAHGIEIEDQPGLNLSPTASRLEFLRRLIGEIRDQVEALKQNESDEPPNYPTEDPPEPAGSLAEASSQPDEIEPASGTTRQSRGRSIRSMRPSYHTPPRDFGELVDQLHQLDAEFAPFRAMYITTLREASDPEVRLNEGQLQRRQRTAEISAEVYHSLSHAYHIVSDIGLLMTHGNSRLTSEALLRHPLPVQAHINVVQSSTTRRPLNTGGSTSGQSSSEGQAQQGAAQAGRNQPTVNINVQPDPITYQVEIETRVPIPVNPDNQSQNQNQNQNPNQNQTQNQNQNANQDGQANRRQIMLDFENLFRGLGQAGTLGGVEVVMSMEEIPQGAAQANPQQQDGAGPHPVFGSQIYLAQMPWGGPPTADLLQNIVSSVIRQGLVPGMESVMHVQHQNQNQAAANQNQNQAPNPNQSQASNPTSSQSHTQTSSQSQGQTSSQSRTSTQTQTTQSQPSQSQAGQGQTGQGQTGQSQTGESQTGENQTGESQTGQSQTSQSQTQDGQENASSSSQPTQQSPRRSDGGQASSSPSTSGRPASQTVSINNLVYDRFLACDSPHARRQLQRRRDETSQAGGPRLRDNSTSRIQNNVETLFERFDRNTINEESLMIATMVTLREATSFSSGRTLVPDELLPLRRRLQVYMRELMQGEYEVGTQNQLADIIFERHAEFINRIASITPIRPSVDIIESMKAVLIRFLNEAMLVMFLDNNEICSRRFRIVYPRMFYELCGVISYCCLEGVEGLRRIYRSFLTDLIQNIDEPVRDLLHSLAMENLNAAISRIDANKVHCAQFIRKRGNQPSTSAQTSTYEEAGSMDTTDVDSQQSEPMQASPLSPSLADSSELEAEYDIYNCPTPPPHELAEITGVGIVPTVTTLLNANLPPSPPVSVSSASTVPTAPIVPTVTTVPNVSSYQTPTTVQSIPIVPTAPMVPSAPTTSTAPIVPATPIVPTVPIVPAVPILPDLPVVPPHPIAAATPIVSATPVIVPAPSMVPAPTMVPAPAIVPTLPTIPAVPAIPTLPIPPISPLSPNYAERSAQVNVTSTVTSNSAQRNSPSSTRGRGSMSPIMEDDSNPELRQYSRGRASSRRSCPFVDDDDFWGDHDRGHRNTRSRYSAPATATAPMRAEPFHFDDQHRRSNASATATTSRPTNVFEPRTRRRNSSSSSPTRPERASVSHRARYNTSGPSTSSRHERCHDSRHSTSAPSTSSRHERCHDPRHTVTSTSTSSYHERSHDSHRGHRGRRTHRGSNLPPIYARMTVTDRLNELSRLSYPGTQNAERDTYVNGYTAAAFGPGRRRHNQRNSPDSPSSQDDSDNLRFVPPAQIAQHWGEDWVPTFTRDIQRQNDPSEPYSDAYLSGMPPKKRRCVRQSRPPTTLNGLISESLSEVASHLPPPEELRAAFREHVRVIARARAATSADYEPRRLVATARFLRQNRSSTRKSAETTSGSE